MEKEVAEMTTHMKKTAVSKKEGGGPVVVNNFFLLNTFKEESTGNQMLTFELPLMAGSKYEDISINLIERKNLPQVLTVRGHFPRYFLNNKFNFTHCKITANDPHTASARHSSRRSLTKKILFDCSAKAENPGEASWIQHVKLPFKVEDFTVQDDAHVYRNTGQRVKAFRIIDTQEYGLTEQPWTSLVEVLELTFVAFKKEQVLIKKKATPRKSNLVVYQESDDDDDL
jgi:hypothetical protein